MGRLRQYQVGEPIDLCRLDAWRQPSDGAYPARKERGPLLIRVRRCLPRRSFPASTRKPLQRSLAHRQSHSSAYADTWPPKTRTAVRWTATYKVGRGATHPKGGFRPEGEAKPSRYDGRPLLKRQVDCRSSFTTKHCSLAAALREKADMAWRRSASIPRHEAGPGCDGNRPELTHREGVRRAAMRLAAVLLAAWALAGRPCPPTPTPRTPIPTLPPPTRITPLRGRPSSPSSGKRRLRGCEKPRCATPTTRTCRTTS